MIPTGAGSEIGVQAGVEPAFQVGEYLGEHCNFRLSATKANIVGGNRLGALGHKQVAF